MGRLDVMFFQNIPVVNLPEDLVPIRKMWRALIDLMVEDAINPPSNLEQADDQYRAQAWIRGLRMVGCDQSGLRYVSDLAGLQPEWVQRKILEFVRISKDPSAKPPTHGSKR